jgi:hypothetical protein
MNLNLFKKNNGVCSCLSSWISQWIYCGISHWGVGIIFLLPLFLFHKALGQEQLRRPDILSVSPLAYSDSPQWDLLKLSQFIYVAQILELYPEHQLFFLARDGEYFYDVARLVTRKTAEIKRIHLVNVSRLNIEDPLLKNYLEGFGLTESSLKQGQKFLFIDTGFYANIAEKIKKLFKSQYHHLIQTQLVLSEKVDVPSSRSFLSFLKPTSSYLLPNIMYGPIIDYEGLPHFYEASDHFFVDKKGRVYPSSEKSSQDNNISPDEALSLMKDLVYDWSLKETQKKFFEFRKIFGDIRDVLVSGPSKQAGVLVKKLESQGMDSNLMRSMILDTYETLILNHNILPKVELEHFQILEKKSLYPFIILKKNAMEEGHTLFELKELFFLFLHWMEQDQWNSIRQLIDSPHDVELYHYLVKALVKVGLSKRQAVEELDYLVRQNKFFINKLLTEEFLSTMRESPLFDPVILSLTRTRNWLVVNDLIQNYFSHPASARQEEAILLIIKFNDKTLHEALIEKVFFSPQSFPMREARLELLKRSNLENRFFFVEELKRTGLFKNPHFVESLLWLLLNGERRLKSEIISMVESSDRREIDPRILKEIKEIKRIWSWENQVSLVACKKVFL